MQAEATIKFRDLEAKKIREPGEVFAVSKERFWELKGKGFVKEAEKPKGTEDCKEIEKGRKEGK